MVSRYKFFKLSKIILSSFFFAIFILFAFTISKFIIRKVDISLPSLFRPVTASRLLMSMDGFRFEQLSGDSVPCRMRAQHADLYESRDAWLQTIEIVYDTADERRVTIIGDEGTLNTTNGNAFLRRADHDVRVVTSDGFLLTTHSLRWLSVERQVRTSDPFKLLGENLYLEGKGLSADAELQAISVNDNVKAVLQE